MFSQGDQGGLRISPLRPSCTTLSPLKRSLAGTSGPLPGGLPRGRTRDESAFSREWTRDESAFSGGGRGMNLHRRSFLPRGGRGIFFYPHNRRRSAQTQPVRLQSMAGRACCILFIPYVVTAQRNPLQHTKTRTADLCRPGRIIEALAHVSGHRPPSGSDYRSVSR